MRPTDLKTKIFLDSGDPSETKQVIEKLGFLDGQTTNPSLVAKNPKVVQRSKNGEKYSKTELNDFYKHVVQEIAKLIPKGSVSVEVYADKDSNAETMFAQGKEFSSWISNAHVKYPICKAGLEAAARSIKEGLRVNMTLCFTQSQAAAVYAATKGAVKGDVFVSPFIGRLDDRGQNGADLIANILRMYESGDRHTEVLAASVRSVGHLKQCILLGADIITAPYKVLTEWADNGLSMPEQSLSTSDQSLSSIPFEGVNLNLPWQNYDISHELTDSGMERFASDWNDLLER